MLVLGLGVFFIGHGLGGWMPEALRELSGFSPMAAANWVALSGLVGVVTSLVVPQQTDRRRLPSAMVGLLAVVAAGILAVVALPTAPDPIPLVASGVRFAALPLDLVAPRDS